MRTYKQKYTVTTGNINGYGDAGGDTYTSVPNNVSAFSDPWCELTYRGW